MFLGIDLGTSSVKILLANSDGEIIDSQSTEYPISYPKEGWAEQNPEDWWEGFKIVVKELGKRRDISKIEGMSFSGQMHGLVLLDENDEVIRPALLWNDGRTVKECEYLNNDIGMNKLISWTGNKALTGFTAPKVLWVKNNEPENFNKIAKIMLPKDYIQYKISGVFASDVSDNSGTLYFDVKNKKWSAEMLEILEIKEKMLPKSYESASIVGTVKNNVAQELGLSPEAKVIIGGGDQAMGAIGTGTIKSGQISISLGTSGVIFINANEFVEDKNAGLHSFCHANGSYHLMGVTLACAGSTKWWIEDVLNTKDYNDEFDGISQMEILENLLFLPYMIGERSPINNPNAKGTLHGLSLTMSRKDITKGIVEGICFSLKDCLCVANEGGVYPEFARVIGGGAKSKDWLQMLSDILELEIRTINTSEGGGFGAIILAMTACGKFQSIAQGCDALISETSTFTPNQERVIKYREKFIKYKKLYQNLYK